MDPATALARAQAELDARLGKSDIVKFAESVGFYPDTYPELDEFGDPTGQRLPTGNDKQTRILRSRSRRVLINASRQFGKSSISSVLSLHDSVYRPGSLTLIVAPSERQSGEMFRKVSEYLHRLPVVPKLKKENEHEVEFDNGSRIVALPSSEGTIRGYSAVTRLILDEAGDVPPDIFAALKPMIARSAGRLTLQGTPKGRRGIFFERWERGEEGRKSHEPLRWERHMATWQDCPWLTPWELADQRADLGPLFAQEYEGSFLVVGQGLVYGGYDETRNLIDALPESPGRPWSYLLGLDFGVINGTAFTVAAWRAQDPVLYIVQSYKQSGMSPTEAADEVHALTQEYSFSRIVADTGGLGKGFVVEAQRRWHLPIEPAKKTDKKGHINILNGDLRRGEIRIVAPACVQLLEEITRLSWVDRGDGQKEDPGAANDALDSFLYSHVGSTAYLNRPKAAPRAETEAERIHRETEESFARDERRMKASRTGHDDLFLMTEDDRRDALDPDSAWEREERWRQNSRVYQ